MAWIGVIFTSCFGEDVSSGILGGELRGFYVVSKTGVDFVCFSTLKGSKILNRNNSSVQLCFIYDTWCV